MRDIVSGSDFTGFLDTRLEFYRHIVPLLPGRIAAGGVAAFEIGATQGKAVTALLEAAGFADVSLVRDYAGLDRVVVGTRPE